MNSSVKTFKRLLVTFTRPYTGKMAIGLVAGFLAGGSLFGILKFLPYLIEPFESSARPGQEHVDEPRPAQTETPVTLPDGEADERVDMLRRVAARYGVAVTDESGRMTWEFMILAACGLVGFCLIKAAAVYVNHYCLRWVGARVVLDLRNALFACLQKQSLTFFGKSDTGQLISRCTYDTALIEAAISGTVADLARAPIEIIAASAFIVTTALSNDLGGLVVGLFLLFPLCICPIMVLGRIVKRYARSALERISVLVSRMQENFTGIRVVKAYNMEEEEALRFQTMNERYFGQVIRALRAEILMTPLMELVAVTALCAFLVMCRLRGVHLHQILPLGAAAVFVYRPVKQLAKINVNVQRSVAAADRIFEILDIDTSIPESDDAVAVEDFRDRIVLDSVSFAYDSDGTQVLDDISITIPKGSVVALVGETGSGKTTVANLLARFYDPTQGRILLDGHDLRDLQITSLRRLIGVVTQETILFNETIADNISYGTRDADREAIVGAAREANAHQFIMEETEGYERVVGEKGFVLSGGQRQRVSIARAILKNPPILILDEATSALDSVTEQLVQEAINRVMEDRTVFVIAHRLSTIKHADLICVLNRGRIAERGTHDELYAAGGTYRRLCDMQFS